MPEPAQPLLVLQAPTKEVRAKRSGGSPHISKPTGPRQRDRLAPQFARLAAAFEARRLVAQQDPRGLIPEQVLVFETVGSIADFARAMERVPGMEWLIEFEDEFTPDAEFFDRDHPDRTVGGKVFVAMTDQQAMRELLALWARFEADPDRAFPRGLGKWREVLSHLKTVRLWSVEDRVEHDVRAYWADRLAQGEDPVRTEIELWHSSLPLRNEAAGRELRILMGELGGQVVSTCYLPEIAYHGFLADLPAAAVRQILDGQYPELALSTAIMSFRRVAVGMSLPIEGEPTAHEAPSGRAAGEPLVALLDGLPLENHALLQGNLFVDDPDGWAAAYAADERRHGTAMASLILHGDLGAAEETLPNKIYVRPVLRPARNFPGQPRPERTPEDQLLVDLIHRAVRRLYEGGGGQPPSAPTARIINLAIGDQARPFDRRISPLARLIDWLAWKYQVLFCISAGNVADDLELGVPRAAFAGLTQADIRREALSSILGNLHWRRLLPPSESINAVTVGALHADSSGNVPLGNRVDVLDVPFTSPISCLGLGYRRAIKPDVLFPGGRQTYREKLGNAHQNATLIPVINAAAPGQKVSSPSPIAGALNGAVFSRGTSNATALAARHGARALAELRAVKAGRDDALPVSHEAVLTKAMLIHGASWGQLADLLKPFLPRDANYHHEKDAIARVLGYGPVDPERALHCEPHRATLIGCGSIRAEEGLIFTVPLPPSLSGKAVMRRLTITLAWFTPINCSHQAYRRAQLWFTPPEDELKVKRAEASWQGVTRGTAQHEILVGDRATPFVDGDALTIKVSCKPDAGVFEEAIPFGLCVSLEVAPQVGIAIYEEVSARVRPAVRVQAA